MPKFKKIEYRIPNIDGIFESFVADVRVNAAGFFYCYIPEHVAAVINFSVVSRAVSQGENNQILIKSKEFGLLDKAIKEAAKILYEPEVEEIHVIRYKIAVSASVAVDEQGNVCPNSGWPTAKWLTSEAFGSCGPGNPQSLSIVACAMTKRIMKYPDGKQKVSYELYYAGGDHHGKTNPAELLNSWNKQIYNDSAKEIPYTDANALFFHRLLLGMTQLILMIQTATFEQDDLLKTIAKTQGNLLPDFSSSAQNSKGIFP